jgi:hypothetical protein
MMYEWKLDTPGGYVRNFGDALYEVLLDEQQLQDWREDEDHIFFARGARITNENIERSLDYGLEPMFIGCSWVGEALKQDLVERALFVGCRGLRTQKALAAFDVEVPVMRDPAYDLPRMLPKGKSNALTIAIPHILDPDDYSDQSRHERGADTLETTVVEDYEDVERLSLMISGARFVLTGSLSVAIVANAYEVPFAVMDSYIDHPEKWEEWFEASGLGEFVQVPNMREGREWYQSMMKGSRQ